MKNESAKASSTSASRSSSNGTARQASKTASNGTGHKENLSKIFEDSLKDIYWAEKYLTKALPKMSKAAYDETLSKAFTDHLAETEGQIERLEQVFNHLGKKAQSKKCPAMEGLVEEGKEAIEEYEKGYARDAALIIAAQKVEHYEIATYGGLAQLARTLGLDEVSDILAETLEEEKETDELLTGIAENNINYEAAQEDEE